MRRLLEWWYRIALPNKEPDPTPMGRERQRYARLTSIILLANAVLFLPAAPIMIFNSPKSPSSPPIAIVMILLLIITYVFGRIGKQVLSASSLILYILFAVSAVMATNPLDPSMLPLLNLLTVAVILAGALLPPIASLIVGAIGCVETLLITTLVPHTTAYEAMMRDELYTITIMLPIMIQLVVAIVVYVIMRHLLHAIQRADQAEEIVALQREIAEFERSRSAEKEALEEGLRKIAETHAQIANGDMHARVSLSEGHVLWSVAIPLNNLLNRMQRLKLDSDMLASTQLAAQRIAESLHHEIATGHFSPLPGTGTPLDPVIIELNKLLAARSTQPPSTPSRPAWPAF
ncbi:hypothetical protein EI42_02708 [Thermosporothrix hazakensis]|jgi:uncharacterized membrane protein|uniref:HAMP domain-containing protein n=2 Tax=Thermosporothrix TaxID=768650 RepID=A0A326UA88_THEHA|nr:hypothetical protein [Thermosporothrix hazakensis]PZW29414.1 hypothetical protein EI42_02708 [Thermosporothrix hazakensis]BBH85702.1 hypothetical protein KTC_04530 [Thermosporothrix sp. COM3]GCE45869.1 hypothetical protein KTH_07380 [Thermosporothrix hazakensis]